MELTLAVQEPNAVPHSDLSHSSTPALVFREQRSIGSTISLSAVAVDCGVTICYYGSVFTAA